MKAIVSVRDAVKNYTLGNVVVPALRGVTLDVVAGDFISIAGPSGSGKTTLLNLIGCVDTPTSGVVEVAGKDTRQLSERELTDLRLHTIGFIFQSFNLVSVLTVFQNIELPLLLQRELSGPERKTRVLGAAREGRDPRLRQPPAERAVGRTAAARRDRAGARDAAAAGAGRRADRQPRLGDRAEHPRSHEGAQSHGEDDLHLLDARPDR